MRTTKIAKKKGAAQGVGRTRNNMPTGSVRTSQGGSVAWVKTKRSKDFMG